jgi:hypothetical protein
MVEFLYRPNRKIIGVYTSIRLLSITVLLISYPPCHSINSLHVQLGHEHVESWSPNSFLWPTLW